MTITSLSAHRSFGGVQSFYSHVSLITACTMRFGLFLPPQALSKRVPLLYWLSGLTCTEENFAMKAGAQRVAAELGLAIVMPDTSPRGVPLPGDHDSYDMGIGAGFYVDATVSPWSAHYRMYSYITQELPSLLAQYFPIDEKRVGLLGHSMGGHGALTLGLRNPHYFRSLSAFAPIASPMRSPWGEKAFTRYLGEDRHAWRQYDATALIETIGWKGPAFLVDQGTNDAYRETQLKPELLKEACQKAGVPLHLRVQEDYDHGYFFIASFIEDHLRFHADNLNSL